MHAQPNVCFDSGRRGALYMASPRHVAMSVSTPTKRPVLAPVNINTYSPLARRKLLGLPLSPPPLTPLGLAKSHSAMAPRARLARNAAADLAATKLKLRLQHALGKMQLLRALPRKISFYTAANVNLGHIARRSATQLEYVPKPPSLAALKLYRIKRTLSFHRRPLRLPLSVERLPPVHKILKTPIKASRLNPDETIDEMTGSSPLPQGTPNSFSVARSLLQLGLGCF